MGHPSTTGNNANDGPDRSGLIRAFRSLVGTAWSWARGRREPHATHSIPSNPQPSPSGNPVPPPGLASEPKTLRLTLPGGVEMVLCRIEKPEGGFRMGARGFANREEPVHTVLIPHAYYMGKYPVTQEQYRAVASRFEALSGRSDPSYFRGDRRPVEQVAWHEANEFCAALGEWVPAGCLPEGYGLFCLPTEAEWEHACRAGTDTEYHTGDGEGALCAAGWFGGNSSFETHAVDAAMPHGAPPQANGFRLLHMHGNVGEWCHDALDEESYREPCDGTLDPGQLLRLKEWRSGQATKIPRVITSPPPDSNGSLEQSARNRVFRGGSCFFNEASCRSATRFWRVPEDGIRYVGFRVCLVPGPAVPPAASANQHEA